MRFSDNLRLALALILVVPASIAARWMLDTLQGESYHFPNGWFVGFAVGAGILIGERYRRKAAKNG